MGCPAKGLRPQCSFLQCRVQVLALSILAGRPWPPLPSHLHPEKAGVGQGTGCRFVLALKEALPVFSEPRGLAEFEAKPGRSSLEQGSRLYRHSGKSPPSSEAEPASQSARVLSSYSTSCCVQSSPCHPKQTSQSSSPTLLLKAYKTGKVKRHK